jgi:hypothetical protein
MFSKFAEVVEMKASNVRKLVEMFRKFADKLETQDVNFSEFAETGEMKV